MSALFVNIMFLEGSKLKNNWLSLDVLQKKLFYNY
jgi:hypothetical protein